MHFVFYINLVQNYIVTNYGMICDPLGNTSKFRSGTRLSESDPINFRLFGIGTDLWSLIAVSDVDNTVADSIGPKYIPMCHHALI